MSIGTFDFIKKLKKIKKKNIYIYAAILLLFLLFEILGVFTYMFEWEYTRYFQYPMHGSVFGYATMKRYGTEGVYIPDPINNYTYVHRIKRKCDSGSNPPELTILIKSALPNTIRREAIRRTWGYENRFSDILIRRVFLLGSSLDSRVMAAIASEAKDYEDILQGDFLDTYYNNTLKTMMGMDWVVQHCPGGSHYFLFADDDYYISIKNVLRFVSDPAAYPQNFESNVKQSKNIELYAGFVYNSRPMRQKYSKWYISLEEYPYNKWPPYVTAGAYILSHDTLLNLYYTSLYTKLLRFDDVYLGILAARFYINLIHCDHFHVTRPPYNGPHSYRYVVASHGFNNPKEMQKVWSECHLAGYA